MPRGFMTGCWACLIAALTCAAGQSRTAAKPAAPAAAVDRVIADFDKTDVSMSPASGLLLAEATGADGDKFLRITAADGGALKGGVIFNLPPGLAPGESGGLAVRLRAAGGAAKIRLLGVDDKNRIILQRRIDLEPAEKMQDVAVPWTKWRWGDATGGGPGEVRRLGLRIEEGRGELELDDLRLSAPAAPNEPPADWLRRVAFGGRDVRTAEAEGMLVATDAPDQLTDADLGRILRRMRAARAVVRRLFAGAVRPVEGSTPPSLLIFRQHGDFVRFFETASKEWNVRIVPPPTPGMTIQNIASSVVDPKQGAARPVFLHESVHAVVANDLRLLSSSDPHSWLQEGLASYVQACVYPKSVDGNRLAAALGAPLNPDRRGAFKPLGPLLGKRVTDADYPQLVTLLAYLVSEKPQWLPTIAMALAEGRSVEQGLRECGTTAAELQAAWLEWGRAAFAKPGDVSPALPVPEEFRDAATD